MLKNKNIYLTTIVWGDKYINLFLSYCLRSLLAPGNILDLSENYQIYYHIKTTKSGRDLIISSAAFQTIRKKVKIEFHIMSNIGAESFVASDHWKFWQKIFELSKLSSGFFVVIIPDAVYRRETICHWIAKLAQGYDAVWTAIPQVSKEFACSKLDIVNQNSNCLDLDQFQINEIIKFYLNPVYISHGIRSNRRTLHPEVLIYGDKHSQQLLWSVQGGHPFCVHANGNNFSFTFTPINCNKKIFYDTRFSGVGLDSVFKLYQHLYCSVGMDEEYLARFGAYCDKAFEEPDFVESLKIYSSSTKIHSAINTYSERKILSKSIQLKRSALLYRFYKFIKSIDCNMSSQILAMALFETNLVKRFHPKRFDVSVFVPYDAAYADGYQFELLRNNDFLIDYLFSHVLLENISLSIGDVVVFSANNVNKSAVILSKHVVFGCINVYVVDAQIFPMAKDFSISGYDESMPDNELTIDISPRQFQVARSKQVEEKFNAIRINYVFNFMRDMHASYAAMLGVDKFSIPALSFFTKCANGDEVDIINQLIILLSQHPFSEGYFELGCLYYQRKEYRKALMVFKSAYLSKFVLYEDTDPQWEWLVQCWILRCYYMMGYKVLALRILNKIPSPVLAKYDFLLYKAKLNREVGNIAESLKTYDFCFIGDRLARHQLNHLNAHQINIFVNG